MNEIQGNLKPLMVLGTSSFSWTTNKVETFEILDVFNDLGGGLIDTADKYGDSERWIGEWIRLNPGHRLEVCTKVGWREGASNLQRRNVLDSLERSLDLLGIPKVKVYLIHRDDPTIAVESIYDTFSEFRARGLFECSGLSNFSMQRARKLLSIKDDSADIFRYLQGPYNLIDRRYFEEELFDVINEFDLRFLPFYGIAKGFLTDKYGFFTPRSKFADAHGGIGVGQYRTIQNFGLKLKMQVIARSRACSQTEVALSWLRNQEKVFLPICGIRNSSQLKNALKPITLTKFELLWLNHSKPNKIKLTS